MTSMLELVSNHRKLIEERTRELFLAFPGPKAVLRVDDGISILLDQLVDTLRRGDRASEEEIARAGDQVRRSSLRTGVHGRRARPRIRHGLRNGHEGWSGTEHELFEL